jgi:hypothetical protein
MTPDVRRDRTRAADARRPRTTQCYRSPDRAISKTLCRRIMPAARRAAVAASAGRWLILTAKEAEMRSRAETHSEEADPGNRTSSS